MVDKPTTGGSLQYSAICSLNAAAGTSAASRRFSSGFAAQTANMQSPSRTKPWLSKMYDK
jgi:hypothetical protein